MIMDYVTLKLIWWGIVSFLLIGFAITGGMDIGVNILLALIGKTEDERRLIINSVGPTWEGNQVWLVTFGASLFAVWPIVYATAFSSLYFALLIVLFMLILRPPGIDYRGKIDSPAWRALWDRCLFTSGLVLALLFGVAVGNLFVGLPFSFDDNMVVTYTGGLLSLISPVTLLFGIVSICMLIVQGAIFLQYKLEAELAARAKIAVKTFGWSFIVIFVFTGFYMYFWLPGYELVSIPDINTSLAVANKIVLPVKSGWFNNYALRPTLWILPICVVLSVWFAMFCSKTDKPKISLAFNSVAIMNTVLTAAVALFPFILPSSSNPNHSLTVWDACSSYNTLGFTLLAVVLLLPIVLAYTAWVYKVMRGKVKLQEGSY